MIYCCYKIEIKISNQKFSLKALMDNNSKILPKISNYRDDTIVSNIYLQFCNIFKLEQFLYLY